ncbi:MAG TPA: hypothetical protein VHG09_12390 [Longimicrobiales bacterium]|nr:hypothetical protein [Longimicrobiales bacterium]
MMMRRHSARRLLLPMLAGLLAIACDDSPSSPQDRALEELSSAVEPLRDLAAAQNVGYEVLVTHPTNGNECLRHPDLGAMGYHYLNPDLVDESVAVTTPEVLIYERNAAGSYEFVAVEYIVPFAIRARDAQPPELFGREFKQNDTFNLWALHAWVGKDNPSGVFADYNPDVSCGVDTHP